MSKKPVDHVNPFLCTLGDHGHCHPGAAVPFGMVQLGPDTWPSSLTGDGDWAHSGYNYADEAVRGFSHIRIFGSGGTKVVDRAWFISLLPRIGTPEIGRETLFEPIDKKTEKAAPGSYEVRMSRSGIHAELTVTRHCGFHRYAFPAADDAHVLIDLRNAPGESWLKAVSPSEIEGSYDRRGIQYFVARFDKPARAVSTWNGDRIERERAEQRGKSVGAVLEYATRAGEVIHVKVGISTVSAAQARVNLDAEIPAWDFEGTREAARRAWEDVADRIELEGDAEFQEIFHSALYHSCLLPCDVTDANGRYRGTDGQVHDAGDHVHYDSYAFWDTFRTRDPLLSLVQPAVFRDIAKSLVAMYEQGMEHHPFPTVRHEHMLTVVLDAYEKGFRDFDAEKAYAGMRREALAQMPESLEAVGWKPGRPDQTLEYAYDDWCVARMAEALGKGDDRRKFSARAKFYRNTWDASIGFFRARAADGTWLDFPDPTVIDEKHVYEGSMWQWRWFVPHDAAGLAELCGGRQRCIEQLDSFFANDLYNQGNQPDLLAPFLFNPLGAPWLAQKWVHRILAEPMVQRYGTHAWLKQPWNKRIFTAKPDGYLLEMDDDCGCMAAWFVLASMGLFPLTPGDPVYQLVPPLFEKVTLRPDPDIRGGSFTIVARNLSPRNFYIQSALLNGAPYDRPWIAHADVVRGGTLVYQMGAEPNKSWGTGVK